MARTLTHLGFRWQELKLASDAQRPTMVTYDGVTYDAYMIISRWLRALCSLKTGVKLSSIVVKSHRDLVAKLLSKNIRDAMRNAQSKPSQVVLPDFSVSIDATKAVLDHVKRTFTGKSNAPEAAVDDEVGREVAQQVPGAGDTLGGLPAAEQQEPPPALDDIADDTSEGAEDGGLQPDPEAHGPVASLPKTSKRGKQAAAREDDAIAGRGATATNGRQQKTARKARGTATVAAANHPAEAGKQQRQATKRRLAREQPVAPRVAKHKCREDEQRLAGLRQRPGRQARGNQEEEEEDVWVDDDETDDDE